MPTTFTKKDIARLYDFQGVGNPSGSTWFIGIEEGGGGIENLRARLHRDFKPIMDNRRMHEILGITKYHVGDPPVCQRTWWAMSKVMLGIAGIVEPGPELLRTYQSKRLGHEHGETFLTELYPLPKPKAFDWTEEYKAIFGFASLMEYRSCVRERRIAMLRDMVAHYQPKRVIAYGKQCWDDFENIFFDQTFKTNGKFRISTQRGKPTVVLTHHLTARSMNGETANLLEILRTSAP